MTFLSAIFLGALAAVAVPVVVHLIYRQRYPERVFTTLRFFDKSIKHNVIQRRLIDKILLALRVLALIALAVGLARPFARSMIGEKRMSAVIVLDTSPSMSRLRDGKPLLDHAKAVASAVVDQLGPSDRAAILTTAPTGDAAFTTDRDQLLRDLELRAGQPAALIVSGDNGAALSIPSLTTDTAKLREALAKVPADTPAALVGFSNDGHGKDFGYQHARLRQTLSGASVSSQPGALRQTLLAASEMLRSSSDGDRKIILISDLQSADWQADPIAGLEGLAVDVVGVEPSASPGPNLGIETITLAAPEAGLNQDLVGTATIRNYGPQPSQQATLTITTGDRGARSEVKLAPIPRRTSLLVNFQVRITGRDRNMLCTAMVKSPTDPFAYDDAYHFQVGVRPPVTTLCINGHAGATGSDRSTFFVMSALTSRSGGSAGADVRECEPDLKEGDRDIQLFQFGAIVLADVAAMEVGPLQRIEQFVRDGGGLLVFAGPKATPETYNAWAFLPATVKERKDKSFVYVRTITDGAEAVADVRERVRTGIASLSTDNWLLLDPKEGSSVLARFSDGSPALIEASVGKGKVVLVATSAHASASNWPLRPAFVLMARSLVQYLAAPAEPVQIAPQRDVGAGFATTIPDELSAGTPASFRLTSDGTNLGYKPMTWFRQEQHLVLPAAQVPGHYLLEVRPGSAEGMQGEPALGSQIIPTSVNHSPRESDLAQSPQEAVAKQLAGANVKMVALGARSREAVVALRTGSDLWRWLLICALAVLVVESVLAWRTASESAA